MPTTTLRAPNSASASATTAPVSSSTTAAVPSSPPTQINLQQSDDEDDVTEPIKTVEPVPSADPAIAAVTDDEEGEDQDDDDQAEDEYEVEYIAGHRSNDSTHRTSGKKISRIEYLVKWKGFDASENTWEPETNFQKALLDDYWRSQDVSVQKGQKTTNKRKGGSLSGAGSTSSNSPKPKSGESSKSTPKGSAKKANGGNSNSPAAKRKRLSKNELISSDTDDDSVSKLVAGALKEQKGAVDGLEQISNRDMELVRVRNAFITLMCEQKSWEEAVLACTDMTQAPKCGMLSYPSWAPTPDESTLSCLLEFKENKQWDKLMASIKHFDEVGQHPQLWIANSLANVRCPQKVIAFYEKHIRFMPHEP